MIIFTSTKTRAASRRWAALLLMLVGLSAATLGRAATVTDLRANTLPGDGVEVRVSFEGDAPEVKGYSIEQPARVALDLLDTRNQIEVKEHNLGSGNVRSLMVLGAKERTRLIFNLDQLTGYKTRIEGQELVITLGADNATPSMDPASETVQRKVAPSSAGVRDIDFRRGDDGEGRVLVELADDAMPVDVREEGGRIVARFVGADVEEDLLRRLDVSDFATPVQFVDTKEVDGSTVITIEPEGSWDYLAYQADNQFSINVKPLTEAEKDRQRRDAFKYTGEKLSLNFQDIEVRSVLQLIADFTDLNLVASDTVSGKITLRLQSVPWDQALDLILKTKGLDKRKVGNVLLVAPADEIAAREKQELESQKQLASLAPLRTEYISINYARAEELARERGILLADTKFEFGLVRAPEHTGDADGDLADGDEIVLIDEMLTPDSSRFWPQDTYRPGVAQPSFDKQFVRDHLDAANWDRQPPAPALPDWVVARTREKYLEAHRLLTGRELD